MPVGWRLKKLSDSGGETYGEVPQGERAAGAGEREISVKEPHEDILGSAGCPQLWAVQCLPGNGKITYWICFCPSAVGPGLHLLMGRLQGDAPPVPETDDGGVLGLPFSAGFKEMKHLAFNAVKRNPVGGHLAQAEKNCQTLKKAQAVFFQADVGLKLQNKFLVKGIILAYAGVKGRAVFQKVLQTL